MKIDEVMRLKALGSAFSALPAGIFLAMLSIRTLAKELIELSRISVSSPSIYYNKHFWTFPRQLPDYDAWTPITRPVPYGQFPTL